jgi:membrane-associated protease RseP (regulator of RpoE activity)
MSRYTRTLTLSLFLLNVLPLPRLDGGILMDAVLHHLDFTGSTEVDIEIGLRERNMPSRSTRYRYLGRVLRGATTGLLGGCVLLVVYDSILRKYMQTTG